MKVNFSTPKNPKEKKDRLNKSVSLLCPHTLLYITTTKTQFVPQISFARLPLDIRPISSI